MTMKYSCDNVVVTYRYTQVLHAANQPFDSVLVVSTNQDLLWRPYVQVYHQESTFVGRSHWVWQLEPRDDVLALRSTVNNHWSIGTVPDFSNMVHGCDMALLNSLSP